MEILRKIIILTGYVLFLPYLSVSASDLERINGAGASFPALIYRIWTYNYSKASGTEIEYHSIGSEAGLSQLTAGTVDFAASDTPIPRDLLEKQGLFQFPMLIGGIAVAVNLPETGNSEIKLTSEVLARIFMGNIKEWNHPDIAVLNPDIKIPGRKITVVHRAEGSGTTWVFSKYLSSVSDDWKKTMGYGKILNWKCGLAARNNSGMANYIKKISGAIGYVEYNYAVGANLKCVMLKNREGRFTAPSPASFRSAASLLEPDDKFPDCPDLLNVPGPASWPIVAPTYIIMNKKQKNPDRTAEMLLFFKWCFSSASDEGLNYVPIPRKYVKKIEESWTTLLPLQTR